VLGIPSVVVGLALGAELPLIACLGKEQLDM
jgi:hypothetical protein